MELLKVTDDNGRELYINPALILSVNERPRTALGTVIRYQNGTTVVVVDGLNDVLKRLGKQTQTDNEGN